MVNLNCMSVVSLTSDTSEIIDKLQTGVPVLGIIEEVVNGDFESQLKTSVNGAINVADLWYVFSDGSFRYRSHSLVAAKSYS